jgi:hypothetical protein
VEEIHSVFGRSPPPRADDVLFGGNRGDWKLNACISHWGEVGYPYKSGFRKAALKLAEEVCARPIDQDLMIYPIVYLYRHHVELVLKDIFRHGAALLDHVPTAEEEKALGRHDLIPLWDMVRPQLSPICNLEGEAELPAEDIEGVTSYVQQIWQRDPDGQRFRYATIKQKKPNAPKGTIEHRRSLDEDLTLVNIRLFAIHLEKLANYLDGLESWFGDLHQTKFDMELDAGGGY